MLKLYVFSNQDGMTVVPIEDGRPDSSRRVYLGGGDPHIGALNTLQVNALIELAFRNPNIRSFHHKAVFYDGRAYAREVKRPKVLLTHMW